MTTPEARPRNPWQKTLIPLLGILILIVIALSVIKSRLPQKSAEIGSAANVEIKTGSTLPDFKLTPFEGKPFLVSQSKAKVLLVNFWATWCEACMVEMPSIVKLRERYQSRGFDVAAINVDENPAAVLPRTITQLKINFPVFTDPEQKLAELFNVQAIPLTVVLNQERKILLVENGERNWDDKEVHGWLDQWLTSR